MEKENSHYPFIQQPGKEIARGFAESKILELNDDWVVKEEMRPGKKSFQKIKEDKADYEFLKEKLGDFVPQTFFVVGENKKGEKVNLILQKRIKGRKFNEISDDEIENNPKLRTNILNLYSKCIEMWETDGRIPDLTGRVNGNSKWQIWDPRFSPNLMVEDNTSNVYLVDTTTRKKHFSKASFPLFRIISTKIVNNLKKFVDSHSN